MSTRRILARTALAAAALAAPVYLIVSTATAERANTNAKTAAALNELLARVAPDNPGGADLVRLVDQWKQLDAGGRASRDSRHSLAVCFELLTLGDWSDPRLDECRESLAFASPLLEELKAGSRVGWIASPFEFTSEPAAGDSDVLIGAPTEIRSINRLAIAALRAAAARGDWAEVEAIAAASLACAAHLGRRPTVIAVTIADSLSASLCDELWLTALEHDVPRDTTERLIAALKRFQRERLPLPDLLDGERHLAVSLLDFYYDNAGRELTWATDAARDPGSGAFGGLLVEPDMIDRLLNVRTLIRPRRHVAERRIDRVFDALVAWASLPPQQRGGIPRLERSSPVDFATSTTAAAMPSILRTRLLAQADVAATIIALRIEQHDPAAYPASLEGVVPPDEIVDPATGEPFEYGLVTHDPHDRPYLLRTSLKIPRPRAFFDADAPEEAASAIDRQNLVPWRRSIEGSGLLDLAPGSPPP